MPRTGQLLVRTRTYDDFATKDQSSVVLATSRHRDRQALPSPVQVEAQLAQQGYTPVGHFAAPVEPAPPPPATNTRGGYNCYGASICVIITDLVISILLIIVFSVLWAIQFFHWIIAVVRIVSNIPNIAFCIVVLAMTRKRWPILFWITLTILRELVNIIVILIFLISFSEWKDQEEQNLQNGMSGQAGVTTPGPVSSGGSFGTGNFGGPFAPGSSGVTTPGPSVPPTTVSYDGPYGGRFGNSPVDTAKIYMTLWGVWELLYLAMYITFLVIMHKYCISLSRNIGENGREYDPRPNDTANTSQQRIPYSQPPPNYYYPGAYAPAVQPASSYTAPTNAQPMHSKNQRI